MPENPSPQFCLDNGIYNIEAENKILTYLQDKFNIILI